jgi:hypothetical protein
MGLIDHLGAGPLCTVVADVQVDRALIAAIALPQLGIRVAATGRQSRAGLTGAHGATSSGGLRIGTTAQWSAAGRAASAGSAVASTTAAAVMRIRTRAPLTAVSEGA